ncbi:MAG: hypothetical protein CMQ41_05960 [Gammaproteobacteria bacterium]|nr:hypothetical protein [Gammaproteobacteria bacterium]
MIRLKRRKILQLGGTLLAGSFSSPIFAAISQKYGGLPIGIHGASFREFDFPETLSIIVEELGLNEIELTSSQIRLHGDPEDELATLSEVRRLHAQLKTAGVKASAYGFVPMSIEPEKNKRLFQMAQELELKNLTVIPEYDALDHLEELAELYDIRLAIHNNAPGRLYDSMEQVYEAIEGRGNYVGACVDIGNVLRSYEDPAAAIRYLGQKVFGIHLKDVSSRSNDSEVIGLGEGVLDTEEFFVALRETQMPEDIACSLEYLAQPSDPVPSLLLSLALAEDLLN